MKFIRTTLICSILIALVFIIIDPALSAGPSEAGSAEFPMLLKNYNDSDMGSISGQLLNRIKTKPFNIFATMIFFLAVLHTFMTSKFLSVSHRLQHDHDKLKARGEVPKNSVSHKAELYHFLGEVEAVFGIWAVTLGLAIVLFFDWSTLKYYLTNKVNFTDGLKYAVVAGAVAGGGLTVIANAPNPAGQSLLKRHFKNGISPLGLLKGALVPTVIVGLAFMLL